MVSEQEQISFDGPEAVQDTGLTADDFSAGSYIKNPEVGESVTLHVLKVERNSKTRGKTKEGVEFDVGLKQKDGKINRFDIHCTDGIYTVGSWEVYFKLFGPNGVLIKYAKDHKGSFTDAIVNIKRLHNGGHASERIPILMKLLDMTQEQATKYQEEIKAAKKEQRLYEVTLVAA